VSRYRLGVDIGGTFTDASLIDEMTGEVWSAKVPSTPTDPSAGFMAGAEQALGGAGAPATDVRYVIHGTTVATNAIIEGRVARSAFVTTEGFRDMLEIARQVRPSLYDVHFEKPRPLIPRQLCFDVPERLDPRGEVLKPLDERAVVVLAEELSRFQVESVAVCLLHSYLNPTHEKRVGDLLSKCLPGVAVSLSSEVAPEIREYLRASTTVINAGIQPVVKRYLERIAARLQEAGISAELLVMQSSGGVYTASAAAARPAFMVESGPAAGVIAAANLGQMLGHQDVISLDMGGTTAKTGLIERGMPRVTRDYQVGATARAGIAGLGLGGYPLRTPVIDLVEIGAGGGSIAWVDSGGMLRVGPRSAGAEPGPVCYGRGGHEPTVTDANLVLGRLNADYFLGGTIQLDVDRAAHAIRQRCAAVLGMEVVEAANGIVEIANAAMVNALHLVSVQRGYDPRDFLLVTFGGAGPLHANALAAELDIPETLVPVRPGIFSAHGLLVTDLKRELTVALMERLELASADRMQLAFAELERQGAAELRAEGVAATAIGFQRQVDARYLGQSYELTVPFSRCLEDVAQRFHEEHDRAYGYSAPEEPVELVNLRLVTVGRIERPKTRTLPDLTQSSEPAEPKAGRHVYFSDAGGFLKCPIYERSRLAAMAQVRGPAVIEEYDSTTLVHPGFSVDVDAHGNLRLTRDTGGG